MSDTNYTDTVEPVVIPVPVSVTNISRGRPDLPPHVSGLVDAFIGIVVGNGYHVSVTTVPVAGDRIAIIEVDARFEQQNEDGSIERGIGPIGAALISIAFSTVMSATDEGGELITEWMTEATTVAGVQVQDILRQQREATEG